MAITRYPNPDTSSGNFGSWTAFTPTGSWVSNCTYTGFYKVVGDTLQVRTSIALAGAPNNVSLTLNLPTNYIIDTAKLSGGTATEYITGQFGEATLNDTGTAVYFGKVRGNSSTTTLLVQVFNATGTYLVGTTLSATVPHTWASTDFVAVNYMVPCKAV